MKSTKERSSCYIEITVVYWGKQAFKFPRNYLTKPSDIHFHISSYSQSHTGNYIKICYRSLLGNLLLMLNLNPMFFPIWEKGCIGIYENRELCKKQYMGCQKQVIFVSFKTMIL